MAVYGEEALKVAFNKGLWACGSPDTIDDGFCAEFYNLEVTPEGTVVPRGEILEIGAGSTRISNTSTSKNHFYPGQGEGDTQDYWKTVAGTTYQYSVLNKIAGPAFRLNVYSSGPDGSIVQSAFTTANHVPWDMCQYRDRVYLAASLNNDIARVTSGSGNDLRVTPITTSVVQALGANAFRLLVHKDRIFAFSSNRIYYTEVAVAGGYPENWNSGNNFIDMPAAGSFIITAHVLNDRIYIFTADSVYTLTAAGSVASWKLELTSPNIRVSQRRRICIVKNNFVYTDDESVFMWPGWGNPIEIGQPVRAIVAGHNKTRVFPYRDGVLVSSTLWSGSGSPFVPSYKHFYFDGTYWMEIRLSSSADAIVASYPRAVHWNSINASPVHGEDLLVTDALKFYSISRLQTGGFECGLTTKDVANPAWEILKRFKYAYLNYRTLDLTGTYQYYTRTKGPASEVARGSFAQDAVVNGDGNAARKLSATEYADRIAYRFQITLSVVTRANATKTAPVRLKDLRLIYNSDTRNVPEKTSP